MILIDITTFYNFLKGFGFFCGILWRFDFSPSTAKPSCNICFSSCRCDGAVNSNVRNRTQKVANTLNLYEFYSSSGDGGGNLLRSDRIFISHISIAITLPFHLQSDIDCEAKSTTHNTRKTIMGFNLCEIKLNSNSNEMILRCRLPMYILFQWNMCVFFKCVHFCWAAKRGEASDKKRAIYIQVYREKNSNNRQNDTHISFAVANSAERKNCDTKSNRSHYSFSKHKIAVVGRSKAHIAIPSGRLVTCPCAQKGQQWSVIMSTPWQNAYVQNGYNSPHIWAFAKFQLARQCQPRCMDSCVCARVCLRLPHAFRFVLSPSPQSDTLAKNNCLLPFSINCFGFARSPAI